MIPKKVIFQDTEAEKMKKVWTLIILSRKKWFIEFSWQLKLKKWFW